MRLAALAIAAGFAFGASGLGAEPLWITEDILSKSFDLKGEAITIEREPVAGSGLSEELAQNCPPACIQPNEAAEGVKTVGELEVISFLEGEVANGTGLLLDSRMPETFLKGTIPGAVNVPYSTLDPKNPYRDEILKALGAVELPGGGLDFAGAMELTMFCSGPWCDQSARAISNLASAGYPAEKLSYYRGGLQVWSLLGLTVAQP
ncbi:MAG: rhodanese-like domain-containing protein [Vannielia sp.]|uniref:rhodanese-like domain-containing protein n=1 Tax=Rhodobacterales TaxID=204455 RepID=UPI0020947DE0|nr:rhodanese-like domain-containing protein [Oceanicola sp. 502str15]MCO6383738.1 rhodanese-like domain-containing protein [Oceanicola sp. 502str15]